MKHLICLFLLSLILTNTNGQDIRNFLQSGTQTSQNGDFVLTNNNKNDFFLRGTQVDQYIRNGNKDETQCLVVPYASYPLRKVLVLLLRPSYIWNGQTSSMEYFYKANINDINNNFDCALITPFIRVRYAVPMAYEPNIICPKCDNAYFKSAYLQAVKKSAEELTEINLKKLTLTLKYLPVNTRCKLDTDCTGLGFDCCSEGQCVNDKQLRSGTDQTSIEFLRALEDIANNPDAILNYPQFYHLCS